MCHINPCSGDAGTRVDLPPISASGDLVTALAAIVQAAAGGRITPDEGQAVAAILEMQRRATETTTLTAGIEAIEAAQGRQQ
jgi:hypothetical protein